MAEMKISLQGALVKCCIALTPQIQVTAVKSEIIGALKEKRSTHERWKVAECLGSDGFS